MLTSCQLCELHLSSHRPCPSPSILVRQVFSPTANTVSHDIPWPDFSFFPPLASCGKPCTHPLKTPRWQIAHPSLLALGRKLAFDEKIDRAVFTGNMKTSPNRRYIFNLAQHHPELLFVNEVWARPACRPPAACDKLAHGQASRATLRRGPLSCAPQEVALAPKQAPAPTQCWRARSFHRWRRTLAQVLTACAPVTDASFPQVYIKESPPSCFAINEPNVTRGGVLVKRCGLSFEELCRYKYLLNVCEHAHGDRMEIAWRSGGGDGLSLSSRAAPAF